MIGLTEQYIARIQRYQCREISASVLTRSAVLIPVIQKQQPGLLYTQRSQNMTHHPGQISFPGGRIEAGESAWQCALREAKEEIGLNPGKVTPLGRIDDVLSPRGFHVECHVGLVDDFEPVLNRAEVDQTYWVSLNELFDPEKHEVKPWHHIPATQVHYFYFPECTVWGVTGKITYELRSVLMGEK